MVVNEFRILLLGVKNGKLGIRLEKIHARRKKYKIYLKQTRDNTTIKRTG